MPDVPGTEMVWPQVKTTESKPTIQIGLPLKIAGIIFWGLVAIGMLMVAAAMPWMERIATLEHQSISRQAAFSTQQILDNNTTRPCLP